MCWKVKWSGYRPGVTQRVGRGIALLFHNRGTRREWVVSSTSRPHFTPGKDPVPILQEALWVPGPVWKRAEKSRPYRDSILDRPARSSVTIPTELPGPLLMFRLQLKCDGTRCRTGREVKRKLANGAGSQYSSHYLGSWYIHHYYRWCAHLGCQ